MKRILPLLLALCLLAAAAFAEKTPLTPGSYEVTVDGRNGPLTLTVTLEADAIASIEIGENQETEGVADPALTILPENILQAQSIAVDVITGASVTSGAVLEAVGKAIEAAGGAADEWKTEVAKTAGEDVEMTADVIIIGGGGAGLSAAAAAGEAGATVILVEKAAALGGNTILSGGIFNTADAEM